MSLPSFGVRQPVPANLLMIGLLIAGLFALTTLRKQFFPEVEPEAAVVRLVYPGATPEEIEENLAVKVEDAIADLDEVDKVTTTLSEGGGGITVEFREGQDPDKAVREIEREIDALQDLPDDAEEITVTLAEPRLPVIMVAVYGEADERAMKRAIRGVKDDLQELPGMGEVVIGGVRRDEVSVDVRYDALLEQGLPLTAVSAAIESAMREVPGGSVRNRSANTNVRTMGTAETADDIGGIVLKSSDRDPRVAAAAGASDVDAGTGVVRVRDVAEVNVGFEDTAVRNRFNGAPSADLTVFKIGDQDIVKIAQMVRAYVAARAGEPLELSWWQRWTRPHVLRAYDLGLNSARPLPVDAEIRTLTDLARFVEGRLDLLTRNAGYGALLVFGTLLVFLNPRVAFWVGVGLVTALAGTLVLMAAVDITLNLLTMFGLIVVLGLLVDDAIVVSENIQSRFERGETAMQAAVRGAGQVQWPVVATVLTSIVAFLPLRFIEGNIGDLLGALPVVVTCALAMSLVECLIILPSHMGHSLEKARRPGEAAAEAQRTGRRPGVFARFAARRDAALNGRVLPAYGRVLGACLRARYLTVVATVAVLVASAGMVAGKRVSFVFLPTNDSEEFVVNLRLPIGSPIERTERLFNAIERAAQSLPEFKAVAGTVGQTSDVESGESTPFTPHIAQLFIELQPLELRDRDSATIIADLRERLRGKLDQADRLSFEPLGGGPGGPDLNVQLRGADPPTLRRAVADLKAAMRGFGGVVDIADDDDLGQAEQRIRVRPADAAAVGLTPTEIALQVRGFLFGLEPHTFARAQEDVDVRVRVDAATRRDLGAIENAWLINPAGDAVPLRQVADIEPAVTYASIKRVDRRRAINVTAYVSPGVSPEDIATQLPIDELRATYPSLDIAFAGRQEQVKDAFSTLPYGAAAAAIMIYIILAWLFGSYLQPLTVMAIIPFSMIGMIWGHWLLGFEMTFLSLIGMVALAGIVVNDSLILVEFYNEKRAEGHGVREALGIAGPARLRAIGLTTITTVLGLTPLILEQSFQARFLIPMAIAIAGGLLSATFLILLVLPCLILILDDIKRATRALWNGRLPPRRAAPASAEQPS